jgi:anti-sigma-K factor RskA
MTGNQHIEIEDLAMFALFLLGKHESEEIRAHVEGCGECRDELARVQSDLAMYALATESPALPEGMRDRFVERLQASHSGSPVVSGAAMKIVSSNSTAQALPARRSPLAFTIGWAGWAVAAAVTVVALGLHHERDALRYSLAAQTQETATLEKSALQLQQMFHGLSGPSAVKVSLTVPKLQANPSARATYNQGTGTLLLLAGNMNPLPADKVYELWLIPANGKSPIPAGTFRPDAKGNANLLTAKIQDAVAAKAFGITVEHAGGSATPTLPILLAGAPG